MIAGLIGRPNARTCSMPGIDREVTFRFLAQPTDVNFGGKVHGGMVMKWIDQAGYACAVGWSGKYCVTVAVCGIRFVHPILIGDLVSVHCQLIYTGTTSMHFSVDVLARRLATGEETLATHCVVVMVATDDAGDRRRSKGQVRAHRHEGAVRDGSGCSLR